MTQRAPVAAMKSREEARSLPFRGSQHDIRGEIVRVNQTPLCRGIDIGSQQHAVRARLDAEHARAGYPGRTIVRSQDPERDSLPVPTLIRIAGACSGEIRLR